MKNAIQFIKRSICTVILLCMIIPLALPTKAMTSFYTFSKAYKTSVYYQRFSKLTLTGDHRYDILNIAFSQLGYHGGDDPTQFDGTNYASEKKFTEYCHWYFGKNGDINEYAWCASFVSWCLRQARVSTATCPNFSSCQFFVDWLTSHNYYHTKESGYLPRSGDIIFFCNLWRTNTSTHVGLVVGVEGNYVYTIEGNSDNSVLQRRYDLQDPYIIGYGTPQFTEKPGTVFDFPLRYTLSGKGEYAVPSGGLTLYDAPTFESSSATVFSAGIHFDIAFTSLGWGRVYLQEDSSAVAIKRTVDSQYKGYKDELEEVKTSSAVWFALSDAIYLEKQPTEYTVKYDYQGGTAQEPFPTQKVPAGSSVILSSSIPQKKGYTFLGWGYTAIDLRGLIQNGDEFIATVDRTVYAVWQPNAPVKPSERDSSSIESSGNSSSATSSATESSAVSSSAASSAIESGAVESSNAEGTVTSSPDTTQTPETTANPATEPPITSQIVPSDTPAEEKSKTGLIFIPIGIFLLIFCAFVIFQKKKTK